MDGGMMGHHSLQGGSKKAIQIQIVDNYFFQQVLESKNGTRDIKSKRMMW
ncbi:MAG: hypothetical protein Q4D65_03295 [Peptostreptococcaceae bacterium]|nr:hypothetical protein [Peptostreptococcaceae bacterium]